jgi:putative transposase
LRSDSFRVGVRLNDRKTSAAWTKERRSLLWASETSCVPPQQALRHLQTAFVNFFDKRLGYPNFKKKAQTQSAEYTRSAFHYDPATRELSFAKLGPLKLRWSRAFVSGPTTATITKSRSGRYHVTLCLDEPEPHLPPRTGKVVAIDLGLHAWRRCPRANASRTLGTKGNACVNCRMRSVIWQAARKARDAETALGSKSRASKKRLPTPVTTSCTS